MGTHPIFESDFDCLTDKMAQSRVELALILYFSKIYLVLVTLIELGLFIYKAISLPYSASNITIDLLIILAFFLTDLGRINTGETGNKTAIRGPVGVSVALTLASAFCSVYIFMFQTVVLNIEQSFMYIYWTLTGFGLI